VIIKNLESGLDFTLPGPKINFDMKKVLKITWQRLLIEDRTCPRCKNTEAELDKAVAILAEQLAPLGWEVVVEKKPLAREEFDKAPLKSNRILINDRPIEEYLSADTGQTPCCDVCGPVECRTIEVDNHTYETVPVELIVRAARTAAGID
jgi:hypothetical protein